MEHALHQYSYSYRNWLFVIVTVSLPALSVAIHSTPTLGQALTQPHTVTAVTGRTSCGLRFAVTLNTAEFKPSPETVLAVTAVTA